LLLESSIWPFSAIQQRYFTGPGDTNLILPELNVNIECKENENISLELFASQPYDEAQYNHNS